MSGCSVSILHEGRFKYCGAEEVVRALVPRSVGTRKEVIFCEKHALEARSQYMRELRSCCDRIKSLQDALEGLESRKHPL